ncbi:MAG TPA: hypothetical protein VF590_04635 [Isosphaeraceae bacterium]|jgi:hypothetical protein
MALFHFDLRHLAGASDLRVAVHGATYDLQPHSASSLAAAGQANPALGVLPPEASRAFTHFSEVDETHFQEEAIRWIQVIRPAPAGVHLSEVVLMAQHLPPGHLRAFYQSRLQQRPQSAAPPPAGAQAGATTRPRLHSAKLAALGLEALPTDDRAAVDELVHAQSLVTPLDTAATLVAHHPGLANIQPYTATVALHDHILPNPDVDPDQ